MFVSKNIKKTVQSFALDKNSQFLLKNYKIGQNNNVMGMYITRKSAESRKMGSNTIFYVPTVLKCGLYCLGFIVAADLIEARIQLQSGLKYSAYGI